MAETPTLTNLVSLTNQTTAISEINANSAAITAAFEDVLSLSGVLPNSMQAPLDMNNNQIINLPAPSSADSPLRVADATLLNGNGTITASPLPAGGAAGTVLTKINSTNYNVEWSAPPSIVSATTGELAVYTSNTAIGGDANANMSTGALTLGQAGSVQGSLTLAGGTSGSSTIEFPATTTGTITLPSGTTNFSSTGGTSQVVQQTTSGGALTVGQLAASNLSNGTTGTGAVVLAAAPTITGNSTFTGNVAVSGTATISGANSITLANLVQEPNGYALLGNPMVANNNYQPFQIGQLTAKASPTPNDLLMIADEASSGALKYATVGEVIGSTVSGVTSINSETGAVALSYTGGEVVTNATSSVSVGSPGGFRNKIRNGTFDIWQRGHSGGLGTGGNYTTDGWIGTTTGANATWLQASNNRTGANTLYGLEIVGATSVTDVKLTQRIESYMCANLAGATVTFQAQVYNGTGGSITPTIATSYAGSQDVWTSPTGDLTATNLQACGSAAWTQVSYTLTVSANAINGYEFILDFGNHFSTTGKNIIIAEVDVRVTPGVSTGLNSSPPPPEIRFIQSELALCQRYFMSSYGNGVVPGTAMHLGMVGPSYYNSTTIGAIPASVLFPVPQRIAPSISYWDGAGTASKSSYIGNSTTSTSFTDAASLSEAPWNISVNGFLFTSGVSASSAFIHYTASSEL